MKTSILITIFILSSVLYSCTTSPNQNNAADTTKSSGSGKSEIKIADTSSVQKPKDLLRDAIEFSSFEVRRKGIDGSFNGTMSATHLITLFGAPDSSRSIYSEYDQVTYTHYMYPSTIFLFDTKSGDFRYVSIKGGGFYMYYNSTPVMPGDDVSVLERLFPQSYAFREGGNIVVNIKHNNEFTDESLLFQYDSSGSITLIDL